MKLSNIRLLVNNFEQSFVFYNELLNLKCTWGDKNSNYASFDLGLSSGLSIFKANLMKEAINVQIVEKEHVLNNKFVIVIEVDNVDNTYKELKNRSIEFIIKPKNMQEWGGMRVAHFKDTDGNLIEIFSNIKK